MLADPIQIQDLGSPFDSAGDSLICGPLRLLDLSPGKTVRACSPSSSLKYTMTISHSESKENKGQITDRVAVRLDSVKTGPELGGVITQATVTMSIPRTGGDSVSAVQLLGTLFATLFNESYAGGRMIDRIAEGEP